MPKFTRYIRLTVLILSAMLIASCETLNVSSIGANKQFIKEDDENRLWQRSKEEEDIIIGSGRVYENRDINKYLDSIVNKITPDDVLATGVSVKVIVIRDSMINAGMFPNGVMFVNSGLLANIDNEAQLVCVLGHELTHFTNRHALKQFRNMKNKTAFFSTLSMVATSLSGLTSSPTDFSSLAVYSMISSVSGYSREQEQEADEGGFNMLLNNNYAIGESVKIIEIFEIDAKEDKDKTKAPYAFLDHPTNEARLKIFKKLCKLHENEAKDKDRVLGDKVYKEMTKDILLDNVNLDIKSGRFSAAKRAVEKYIVMCPNDPAAYYYLGEIFFNRNEKDDQKLAMENYKKAIALNNNFAPPYRDLGLIYYKNKNYNEAAEKFNTYLSLSPNAEDKKYIVIYLEELKKGEKQ